MEDPTREQVDARMDAILSAAGAYFMGKSPWATTDTYG
jgi:hypothetical protein